MRRLLPEPAGDVSVADLVEELEPWDRAYEERPFVYINFAVTLDGRTTIGGVSREIGSERDTEMLVGLRTRADAVMIGAGTLRAENYGRVIADPKKREHRESLGLGGDPLMVIVSGRMDLPWDAPIFEEDASRVVIFTASRDEPPETKTEVEVVRHEETVDIREALRWLRGKGVRSLLSEGGAALHGALHHADCVDEIFVTHVPKLAGGHGPTLVEGLPAGVREVEIAWLVSEPATGELFARYRRVPPTR